jgi:hypothetical protein
MSALNTAPNLPEADLVYADLIEAHRDLEPAESGDLNAQLVLILANHIGDRTVISEAIALARRTLRE